MSTIVITLFGEIVPQAVCARHGLRVGGNLSWFVWGLQWLLYPVVKPIAFALNCILGTPSININLSLSSSICICIYVYIYIFMYNRYNIQTYFCACINAAASIHLYTIQERIFNITLLLLLLLLIVVVVVLLLLLLLLLLVVVVVLLLLLFLLLPLLSFFF